MNKNDLFSYQIETISRNTQFKTTKLTIYDKSYGSRCNRLIVIEPFYWIVLAVNSEVYILNAGVEECPPNYANAIVIPKENVNNFNSVCIKNTTSDWIDLYSKNSTVYSEVYEIEQIKRGGDVKKFTIIDALNYLFSKYITIGINTKVSLHQSPLKILNQSDTHISNKSVDSTYYPNLNHIIKEASILYRNN